MKRYTPDLAKLFGLTQLGSRVLCRDGSGPPIVFAEVNGETRCTVDPGAFIDADQVAQAAIALGADGNGVTLALTEYRRQLELREPPWRRKLSK